MKKLSFILLVSMNLLLIAVVVIGYIRWPRIGVVNNQVLFASYDAVAEAESEINTDISALEYSLDSLKNDIDYYVNLMDSAGNETEKIQYQQLIRKLQNDMMQYRETRMQMINGKRESLLQSIYQQVNDFSVEYGESEKYDLLIGVTDYGNVLYASDKNDITEDFSQALNQEYNGE